MTCWYSKLGVGTGRFRAFRWVLAFSATRPESGGFEKTIPETRIQCGLSARFLGRVGWGARWPCFFVVFLKHSVGTDFFLVFYCLQFPYKYGWLFFFFFVNQICKTKI
jgi:hypothetical protein